MKHRADLKSCLSLILAIACCLPVIGQRSYLPEIDDAQVEVYKTIGDVELNLWIKTPARHNPDNPVPAIIFYFGGGWNAGSPGQFVQQAEWLAGRGMVAVLADYRVLSRHNVPAKVCVEDAKSAIRYLRKHAARLGIDPDRIVAAGGSAGGHLAAAVATLPGFNGTEDDTAISAVPNALALFNPAVVLAPIDAGDAFDSDRVEELKQRMGADPITMSPYHNLSKGVAPTIIFHGTDDPTVPYVTVEAFHDKMISLGNRCELVAYKGARHGFFNADRDNNIYLVDTMNRLDAFLVSLGYLKALPEVVHVK